MSQNGQSPDLSDQGIGEQSSPTRWPKEAKLILEFSYLQGVSCFEQVTALAKDENGESEFLAAIAVSCFRNAAERIIKEIAVEYLQRIPRSLGLVREHLSDFC